MKNVGTKDGATAAHRGLSLSETMHNGSSWQMPDAVELRLLITAIASGMILSFSAGIAFGPTLFAPTMPLIQSEGRHLVPDTQAGLAERHVAVNGKPSYEELVVDGIAAAMNSSSSFVMEEEHDPAGQHLLVDIRNVDHDFLDSEERLALAMVEVVHAAQLTLLSYHCHSLEPAGVSCVGVLLESHISFHTWPDEGVITLDLFTCGSNPLVPVVPVIEGLFGIPRPNTTTAQSEVETMWSHELRGFRSSHADKAHYLDVSGDLSWWVTSPLEMVSKREVVSIESEFHRIDIWDVIDVGETPSYSDMLEHDLQPGDPRFFSAELSSPDRLLFLDGKLQSMKETDHEFHEALVHPAMFAHPSPRRVAIIGGGEGAALREVLKHKTVEEVKMIEIDQQMVEVARQHLPFFNDCSDLVISGANCFDDPRAEIIHQDGIEWFLKHYGSQAVTTTKEQFQVIVVDALHPEEDSPGSASLFNNADFLTSILDSLSEDGVIVINAGVAPTIHDPPPHKGVHSKRENLFRMLEAHADTKAMLVYEESHCGFNEPHSFLVICKSHSCRQQWYAGADAIDFQIYERITTTHSRERALKHFDGATQYSYQFPPKAWETMYCLREPTPSECAYRGLDVSADLRDLTDDDESDFYVEKLDNGEVAVYAAQPIKKGDYIMPDALASSFVISDQSKQNLIDTTKIMGTGNTVVLDDFLAFIEKHGHQSIAEGIGQTIVEIGGSFLIRSVPDRKKANVDRMITRPKTLPTFSPVYERNRRSFDVFLVATRDIDEDEEVLKYDAIWD